jgi:hypothetical protein
MRLYYSNQLTSGMTLGRSLFDRHCRLLLKEGLLLNTNYISLICSKNIPYVFIDDTLSKGLTIEELVSDKIKYKIIDCYEAYIFLLISKIPSNKKKMYDRFKFSIDTNLIKLLPYKELRVFVEEVLYDIESCNEKVPFFSHYKYQRSFTEINFDILVVSILIGLRLDYGRQEILQLGMAALLHDIGWIFSPNYNVSIHGFSSQEITDELHVLYGYKFLRESKHLTALEFIPALEHHELGDGKGFPDKKISDFSIPNRFRKEKNNQIFRLSEIVGIVSELINRSEFEAPSEILADFKLNKDIKYNSHIINELDYVFNPFPISIQVSLTSKDNKIVGSGIVTKNLVPRFIPTVRTVDLKIISAYETSRLNIKII